MRQALKSLNFWLQVTQVITILISLGIVTRITAADEMLCGGKPMHYNETQERDMKMCLGKFGVTSIYKLKTHDIPCFMQCLLTVRGFVSPDGESIEKEKFMDYIDMIVEQADLKETLKKNVALCISQHGEKVVKDDQSCMSYLEVGSCVKESFFDACIADD